MMSVYSLARPATARPSDARACAAPHGGLTSLDERQRKGSAENICREHLDLVANHESKSLRAGRLERAGKGGFIHNCDTEMGENAPNTTTSCLQASRDGEAPSLALRLRRGAVAAAARLGTQTGTHSLWLLAAVPPKKSRDTPPPHTHTEVAHWVETGVRGRRARFVSKGRTDSRQLPRDSGLTKPAR